MAITAEMVKDLRDKTGAGMMDCKRAMVESNGDMEKAIEILRKSGITKAEKKSGRTTKEGKITARVSNGKAVLTEVLCETDFVSTNEKFINFVSGIIDRSFSVDGDGDVSAKIQDNEKDNLVNMIATIGENMQIRRVAKWNIAGNVATYIHGGGRIGVMVEVEGEGADADFLNDLCLHIAAFSPTYICSCCIPADTIAKEREIASAQVAGKPANIVEKIVDGKIAKWFTEVCLVNQPWIKDDKTCVSKLKPNLKVKRFVRWDIKEDIE